jgi:hypothetical protein
MKRPANIIASFAVFTGISLVIYFALELIIDRRYISALMLVLSLLFIILVWVRRRDKQEK